MKQISKLLALCLLLSFGFFSCKKEEQKPNNSTPTTKVDSYFFSATIDGKPVQFEHKNNNYVNGAGSSADISGSATWMGQSSIFANMFDTKLPQAGIEIVKFFNEKPTCGQVKGMFETKSYGFGSGVHNNPSEGVVIFYSDYKGNVWSSDYGLADQTGSSFKFTEHLPNSNGAEELSEYTSKAEFNCTLYDNNGNSIKLTNGKMWAQTVQCNNL